VSKTCNYCHKPIRWATTAATGARMPLDAAPTDRGNVVLADDQGAPVAGVLSDLAAAGARASGADTYLHHGVTCPFAAKWNKGAARR
jgi:hypothetical protein